MGLFDFLKNKNEKNRPEGTEDAQWQYDIDKFEKEFLATIPRYISVPGAAVNIQARHQKTNEIIPFAEGFPEQFHP